MAVTDDPFGRRIPQLALFLENRPGRLLEVVRLLAGVDTHLLALSLQEAPDHAVVRIIVDRPAAARAQLEQARIPFVESAVLAVELSDEVYSLPSILRVLLQAGVNVVSAYPLFVRAHRRPVMVFCVDHDDRAIEMLQEQGLHLLNQNDLARGESAAT